MKMERTAETALEILRGMANEKKSKDGQKLLHAIVSALELEIFRLEQLVLTPRKHAVELQEKNHTYFCSFCGKGNLDVEHMVAGDAAAICVKCIEICVESVEIFSAFRGAK